MAISWWFVGIFTLSGTTCFAAALHGSRLQNGDARRGLRWLLIAVGVWGVLQAGVLLAGRESTATLLYLLSLIIGFSTVFAWLYFASAYAGHEYHRRPAYRWAGVVTFVAVSGTKATNPIHGLYFTAEFRTEPVRRLVVDQGLLYWGSFLLAYVLSAVGFYLLYRLYRETEQSSLTLAALFAATGLAVVPNLLARTTLVSAPQLSYEPLGVAVFAVGIAYLVEDAFLTVEKRRNARSSNALPAACSSSTPTGRSLIATSARRSCSPRYRPARWTSLRSRLPSTRCTSRSGPP